MRNVDELRWEGELVDVGYPDRAEQQRWIAFARGARRSPEPWLRRFARRLGLRR